MWNFVDEIHLDKGTPVPLYYQLKKDVLSMIEKSLLKDGDMLPPENELCGILGVSRPTIRQAFNELVTEGYLTRRKGKGTFVSMSKVEDRFLNKFESFKRHIEAKDMTPATDVLALRVVEAHNEAHERLCVDINAPLIYLSRLRAADNVPLVYVETYISFEKYPLLFDVDYREKSLYDSFEELYGIYINRVIRETEAVNSRKAEAQLLKISVGKAVSLVKTLGYADAAENAVEYSVARYRGDLNKFTVEVSR